MKKIVPHALPLLAACGLALATPARADLFTNLSFATADNVGFSTLTGEYNSAHIQRPGLIGQTYYYKFLDLAPTTLFLGFQIHDASNFATGPLAVFDASLRPVAGGTEPNFLLYAVTPGVYYVTFDETTIGFISAISVPTTSYDLVVSSYPQQFTGPQLLADVPEAVPAVPEPATPALLAALLPLGAAMARRRVHGNG